MLFKHINLYVLICTNQTMAQLAHQTYVNIWSNKQASTCKVPCKRYSLNLIKLKENRNSHERNGFTTLVLSLDEGVVMSDEVFLYSILSLIAEVGGYVGLFLGVSVNQLSTLYQYVIKRFTKMNKNIMK